MKIVLTRLQTNNRFKLYKDILEDCCAFPSCRMTQYQLRSMGLGPLFEEEEDDYDEKEEEDITRPYFT